MDPKHFQLLSDYDKVKYDLLINGKLENLIYIVKKITEDEYQIKELKSLKTIKGRIKHRLKRTLPKRAIDILKNIVY